MQGKMLDFYSNMIIADEKMHNNRSTLMNKLGNTVKKMKNK